MEERVVTMTASKALLKLRKQEQLTQQEMAVRLGVSYSHYTKLERNFVNPGFDLLSRVKQTFNNVDMNEFFEK